MPPAIVLFVFPLLAAGAPIFDLSARAEARTESLAPGFSGPTPRLMQLDVSVNASASEGEWRLLAGYQPRLLIGAPDSGGKNVSSLLNNARLSAGYLISNVQRLRVDQALSYGRQDFSPLTGAVPGGPPSAIPLDPRGPFRELLVVFTSKTTVVYSQTISPRLTLDAQAGFQVNGGADGIARSFLPLQRGVPASVRVDWVAGKHDSAFFSIDGATNSFSAATGPTTGPAPGRTSLVTASIGWKQLLDLSTTLTLSAGGDSTKTTTTGEPSGWQPSYHASAALTHAVTLGRQRATGSMTLSVNTTVDRLTGAPYRLGSALVSLGYQPTSELALIANASGGRGLSGAAEAGQQLIVADVAGIWQTSRDVGLAVGVRSSFQAGTSAAISPTPQGTQWAGYVAITFIPRGRF